MEQENKMKVKLSTAVILLLLIIAILIVSTILIVLNLKKKDVNNNQLPQNEVVKNETVQNEIEDPTKVSEKYESTDFDYKFLKLENKKENMIYSPLSIKYAFQMLNEGASGNTKTQLENVIGKTAFAKHDNIENILSLANAMYIRDAYANYIKEEYKNTISEKYNAEINSDKFQNADNMNKWIDNKTFGQIKNVINDEIIKNPDTKMVLINALAIDMEWKTKFDAADTHQRTFYISDSKKMDVAMMNQETKSENVAYYKDDKVTVLSMDLEQYENEQMEFIAIMPNTDLSKYVESFNTKDLKNITNNLTKASSTKAGLDIYMPKFSFDYSLKLVEDMKTLGVTDAFSSSKADFSNITNADKLFVGDAIHKANIDCTEKGVKAAAVTVIYMMANAMIPTEQDKPIEIKIDHPFMYIIKDKNSDEIWFVGTVYEPNSWEDEKANYEVR